MTIKNPDLQAHLQIKEKHSATFQINLINDVEGVAGTRSESVKAIIPSKMSEIKIKKKKKKKKKKENRHTFMS